MQIETGIHAKDRSQGIATTWEDGLDPYAGHGPSTGHSQGLCAAKNQELMEGTGQRQPSGREPKTKAPF